MPLAGRLYVTLWAGPADGRIVRVYESTEEVHVPTDPVDPSIVLRYVRDTDGIFRFQGTVEKGLPK